MNDLERDLMTTGATDAFEASVFRETVATARRARRIRNISRVAVVAGLFLAAFQLPLEKNNNDSRIVLRENVSPPAPVTQVFRSKTFAGKIQTTPLSRERTLDTKVGIITVVRTSNLEHPEIARINDDELLSLFRGEPVALIGRGANAELIFPDSTAGN